MPTVIIVDDDPRLCVALRFKLEGAGYQVFAVGNAQAFLAQLKLEKPDLILLDKAAELVRMLQRR